MINEIIYWELYALVVSFFNGVLLAWIYDNIRAFRRIVRHKTDHLHSIPEFPSGTAPILKTGHNWDMY